MQIDDQLAPRKPNRRIICATSSIQHGEHDRVDTRGPKSIEREIAIPARTDKYGEGFLAVVRTSCMHCISQRIPDCAHVSRQTTER
jgi:hypothetical protein